MVDVAVSPQPVQRLHDLTSQSQEDGCSDECDPDPEQPPVRVELSRTVSLESLATAAVSYRRG